MLVPFTLGSTLKNMVQRSDREFVQLVGGGKPVRVVEKGGDKLINTLGRNDPWGGDMSCQDETCVPCGSRRWIREERKLARSRGEKLPDNLLTKSSNQCRREGCNYTLQCLGCLETGQQSLYRGETARSGRQRQKEHSKDLETGAVTSPIVLHTIEVHGGVRLRFLALLDSVEPRAMYRLIRESIKIQDGDPASPYNMNRCQEWGGKTVLPEVQVTGGSRWSMDVIPDENPRPEWTRDTKRKIEEAGLKRVKLEDQFQTQKKMRMTDVQEPVPVDANHWLKEMLLNHQKSGSMATRT